MTDYISPADTAKLIRKALKEAFPGQKFSVRTETYSMGASIRVCWTDGPTADEVDAIAGTFQGGTFDAMTDYKGGVVHNLNGQQVHFGADYVFTHRDTSPEFLASFKDAFANLDDESRSKMIIKSNALRCLAPYETPDAWYSDAELTSFGDNAGRIFDVMASKISGCKARECPSIAGISVERTY